MIPLPCPFCASEPSVHVTAVRARVQCDECTRTGLATVIVYSGRRQDRELMRKAAIANWNTRMGLPARKPNQGLLSRWADKEVKP